jgi:hypothetical protein
MNLNNYRAPSAPTPSPVVPRTPGDYAAATRSAAQLSKAIGAAHEVLCTATTVFPFTLFPDTITIDRSKLTVTRRQFFRIADMVTLRIEDVLNVVAHVGPLFGSVEIATRFFSEKKPYRVNWLTRQDALRLKRIMQGYIIAMQKKIDCSALSTHELATMLDELGKGAPATASEASV